jgi:hypothetical protein
MSQPTHEAIAARAHALWLRGGAKPGRAIDDWLQAERELREEAVARPGATPARPPSASSSFAPPPAAVAPHGAPPARPAASPTASFAPSMPPTKQPVAPTAPAAPPKGGKKKRKR